jgi:hypothetical protein
MATHYWYDTDGQKKAYLAEDGKWFFHVSGGAYAYISDGWIYSREHAIIGRFDDAGAYILDRSGKRIGYVMPKLPK